MGLPHPGPQRVRLAVHRFAFPRRGAAGPAEPRRPPRAEVALAARRGRSSSSFLASCDLFGERWLVRGDLPSKSNTFCRFPVLRSVSCLFPPQEMSFAGRGKPPTRFLLLYLPAALAGEPLPRASCNSKPNRTRLAAGKHPLGRNHGRLSGAVSCFLKRWWWALLARGGCLGLWRLRFDVDILNLLPPDEPTVQGLKLYQQHFTNARELVITLRAPDAEQAGAAGGRAGRPLAAGDKPGRERLVAAALDGRPGADGRTARLPLAQPTAGSVRRADQSAGARPSRGRAGPNQGRTQRLPCRRWTWPGARSIRSTC